MHLMSYMHVASWLTSLSADASDNTKPATGIGAMLKAYRSRTACTLEFELGGNNTLRTVKTISNYLQGEYKAIVITNT